MSPLRHAEKAEAGDFFVLVETFSHIYDFQADLLLHCFERDADMSFSRVLRHVPEGFLGDAIQGGSDHFRDCVGNIDASERSGHAFFFAEFLHQGAEGERETQIVKDGGMKTVRDAAYVIRQARHSLAKGGEFTIKSVRILEYAGADLFDFHLHQGKLLAQIIVKFAGNVLAFFFLRVQRAAR